MEPQQPSLDDARPTQHVEDYIHGKNVKKGVERLDRRPITGNAGNPKKQGHGGKFTWGGPTPEDTDLVDPPPVALDEGDPNYVDDEEEARDAQVGVTVVEVPKVAGSQGVSTGDVDQKEL